MKYPTISVIMATYNSAKTVETCLRRIREQDYPQEKIEIILGDGGSRDQTLKVAKKYRARVVKIKDQTKQGAEYNRAVAAQQATGELLAVIDHDNLLPHNLWLKRLVQPFLEDKKIVGSETIYYRYDKSDSLLGRYFALFGFNDVLPFYLGKADRLAHYYTKPQEYGVFKMADISETPDYFLVDFHPAAIPTIGSNGFLIRRKILFSQAQTDLDHYYHIDVNVDLIRKDFRRYAFVKDSLWHKTGERGIWDYLRRRKLFMEKYYLEQAQGRRFMVYESRDAAKLLWFVFISLTLVKPTLDAARGFSKIRDVAWFVHPFMCLSIVILYTWVLCKKRLLRI